MLLTLGVNQMWQSLGEHFFIVIQVEGELMTSSGVEARDAPKHPTQYTEQTHNKEANYPTQMSIVPKKPGIM